MRAAALVALATLTGCAIPILDATTVDEFERSVEQIRESVRHYQLDVLFPALASATEAERQRYRQLLDDYETVCGAEPPRFGRREWDRCVEDAARRAAAELGIETFGDYLADKRTERRGMSPPPRRR